MIRWYKLKKRKKKLKYKNIILLIITTLLLIISIFIFYKSLKLKITNNKNQKIHKPTGRVPASSRSTSKPQLLYSRTIHSAAFSNASEPSTRPPNRLVRMSIWCITRLSVFPISIIRFTTASWAAAGTPLAKQARATQIERTFLLKINPLKISKMNIYQAHSSLLLIMLCKLNAFGA